MSFGMSSKILNISFPIFLECATLSSLQFEAIGEPKQMLFRVLWKHKDGKYQGLGTQFILKANF
jgi:hypothetical protein